jgi:hypothetical protein
MPRFSVDVLNHIIDENRNRIAKLAGSASDNSLMPRVVSQLELSVKILERHRDEMLANKVGAVEWGR